MRFYEAGRAERGFEGGIQKAIERLLVAPEFLFRVERDPVDVAAGAAYRLTDLELASRLSFFLWSGIPDDELLDAAEAGRLAEPDELERQVRRMLADPRATALVDNFASQWLQLRRIRGVAPDADIFYDFDENLRADMERETTLFLESQLREDRGLLELLTADYTFVNERLARHYGIPGVYGERFRRVAVDPAQRGGLLGHASLLTLTAYPNRTSPVLRGKWVLDNVLGMPPPEPPADVPGPGGEPRRTRGALDARPDGAAPRESGLRLVPSGDGPAGLRPRELRRHRTLARRRRGRRAGRHRRGARRRHAGRHPGRVPRGAHRLRRQRRPDHHARSCSATPSGARPSTTTSRPSGGSSPPRRRTATAGRPSSSASPAACRFR